ncbi:MAG: hypothetical protein KGR47_07245, partial [Acidobacteria bacterium]|nr:hypothetical protein [Acidobacteriota bacterium]
MSRIVRHRHLTTAVLLATLLAACGTSGGDTKQTTATTTPQSTAVDTTAPGTTEATPSTEAAPPADLFLGFNLSSGDLNATREKYGVKGQNSNLLNEDYY